jgi:Fuc2NAc and GlcNAc transferase
VTLTVAVLLPVVLALSALFTGLVRRLALSHGVLDIPNERSSHSSATPRGGGLGIVIAFTTSLVVLVAVGACRSDLLVALGGGLAVAAIGFLDDRSSIPAGVRLGVHFAAALWAVYWLGGLPRLMIGAAEVSVGWVGDVLAVLGIVWTLNLFNFMDGIDGIAASEAVFVAIGAALLSLLHGGWSDVAPVALLFSAACTGFLLWNWPPAKIFMGDVGSGFLGFVIAVLAIASARDQPATPWQWLILGGVFFVDATVTLIRRAGRRQRLYEPHRTHAYQWLARRWGSHRRVTVGVTVINVVWLLPCALLQTLYPQLSGWLLAAAFTPITVLALVAGAGRLERRES